MFIWKTSKGSKVKIFRIGITNCYFAEYEDLNILIDAGPKRFSKKIISLLKSNLGDQQKLEYLLLTHTHFDHSQNAKIIYEKYNPKLIVHKSESECLKKGYTQIPDGTLYMTKIMSKLGRKFTTQVAKYDAVNPDLIIDSEFLIKNNPYLKIISTPGHTEGSVSLIIDDEIAIVGDTMFAHFKNTIMPPFANDVATMLKSWEKLFNTNCETFLPAHGKAISKKRLESELSRYKNREI